MSIERTFGIVKPDAVAQGRDRGRGRIWSRRPASRSIGLRLVRLSERWRPRAFYAVHKARPFFDGLVAVHDLRVRAVVMAIEGENAVARYREVMGPTDSKKAPAGTIRQRYGTDIEKNAVHGSDGPDTARGELAFFFSGLDLG